MSRQFRYRVTTIVVGGFLLGAPFLTNEMASAAQFGAGDDATSVQITARATGPATMSSPLPVPLDLSTVPAPAGGPHRPGGVRTPTTSAPGSARPDVARPHVVRPHPTKPSASRPPAKHPSVDRPRVHRSSAGRPRVRHTRAGATRPRVRSNRTPHHTATRPQTKVKTTVKTPTGTAEAPAGGRAGGVPGLDVTPTAAGPRAGAEPTTRLASQSAVAEPVATMRPLPVRNRVGLLGLIAAVCALGVTIAAIRSIVSERANRPIMA